MLPRPGKFFPRASAVAGVNNDVIARPFRTGRWKAIANTPSIHAAREVDAAEVSGDLAAKAGAFGPGNGERCLTAKLLLVGCQRQPQQR